MLEKVANNQIVYFKILLGVILLSVFALALQRDFDHDELEAIHSSWKILTGERIYVDFFQHHHSLFYYTIAPIIDWVGENTNTLIVLRMLMFVCYLAMLWCAFQLAKLIFEDQKISWLSVLFLACLTMFSQKAFEVRPDVPQVMLALFAILLIFRHLKQPNRWLLYLSPVLMGLSFLFLQKTLFIIAGVGLMQLYWLYEKKLNWIELISYWVVFVLTITPYYMYLVIDNQFENYLFWNWILNMNFEGSFPAFKTIFNSFHYNHFLWIFFVVGVVICVKNRKMDIVILTLVLLATTFLVKAPYRQYFMPFAPFMCAITAYGLYRVMQPKLIMVLVLLIFLVPLAYYVRTVFVYTNRPQLDKMNWVLERTEPNDYVYDGDIYFNMYRRDIDFFWYSTEPGKGGLGTYKRLKPYSYDLYESIQKFKPKVVSTLFIENLDHPVIKSNYMKSDQYEDLLVRVR